MKIMLKISLCALAAVMFLAGCTTYDKPANTVANANTTNTNSGAKPAAPTMEALKALETKAFEAWKTKDGKFFDGFLTDNFVGINEHGDRLDRAGLVKMIAESKCDIKSYSFSDEKMLPVGTDVAVVVMKVTADYTCDGKKGPSPVTSASVYVRSGDTWKGAYHNEVTIVDPKDMKAAPAKTEPAKTEPAKPAATTTAPAADPLTDSLMALEKKGWEAWKARDAKLLEEMTGSDILLVNPMGQVVSGKAEVIKAWTEPKCEVKSVDVSNGKAVSITADTAILTFKGDSEGTCEGQPLMPLWGTNVLIKTGDTWKPVFFLETPAS